ncbi:MAG: ABC transporter permease [Alphaproteobacteria bacterium]|nr:ABC transporter permease [Alphaproteobacteria bacterium]
MTAFIVRRLMQSAIVVLVMTLLVFFGVMVVGDPMEILVTDDCGTACRAAATVQLGLHLPLHEQYIVFIKNMLGGDLGRSFVFGTPVYKLLLERMPATLELAVFSMTLTVVLGIPLGLWAGLKPDAWSSRLIMAGSIMGFSLPAFWFGIILIVVFSIELGWLPAIGRGATVDVWGLRFSFLTPSGFAHLILPAISLSLTQMALIIRLTRSGMREAIHLDYIKFAHSKGLSSRRVVFVHLLKNILIPIVTVLGLEFGTLLAYSLVTETVFAWPGLGKLLIDSINLLDRPVVVTYLAITVLVFIVINLTVDIAYSLIDPRVRLYGARR